MFLTHFYLFMIDSGDSTINLAQETAKKMNAFQHFWSSITWNLILSSIIEKTIYILFISLLFICINRIGIFLLERTYRNYSRKKTYNENRLTTLHTLINNAFHYTVFFFYLYSLLGILGVPIGSLLAGAGIAGIAIGLGAQGFMNDIITGFFIILEQQMDVGDHIRLGALNIEGTVMAVGLRTTQLKAADGTVHFVPNRNITTISNLSRENIQVTLDIRIIPDEGYPAIVELLQKMNQELTQKYQSSIQTGPEIFGMIDLGNGNFAIRTTIYVSNGQQAVIKEAFLNAYVQILTEHNFTIPNTPIILP